MDYKPILVTSGFGGNTRQPFVEIRAEQIKKPMQISPNEARELASNLLQAAEAAEQDAFLFDFAKNISSGDDKAGAVLVAQFRMWRTDHGMNK